MRKKKQFTKIIDETIKLSNKSGNGILKILMSVDEKGKLGRYSLAYINQKLCTLGNVRVHGYGNSHSHHHRYYMGKEEPVEFNNYEGIAERFKKEWRAIYEKIKNMTVKTGSVEEFFDRVKQVMRAADRNESLSPSQTLTFADPQEMLTFLSGTKIKLINAIREHPDLISNIAKATHRN